MCRIKLLRSKIRAALAPSGCLVVFALQKQHVMLEGKCLTQFICCLVRKNFWKRNRIIRVPRKFKMSEVPNINTGQTEALAHVNKNGKDVQSNKPVLILLNKETSVAAKSSLLSQPGVPGTAEDPCGTPPLQRARERPLHLEGSGLP